MNLSALVSKTTGASVTTVSDEKESGTCKESIDALVEYLDGDMQAELRSKLEYHLKGCSPCEEFLAQYRATVGLCKKALAKRMPQEVAAKLTSFLRENAKKPA